MTTVIQYVDRDDAFRLARAEKHERENESAIDRLIRQISKAREELRLSEHTLTAIEESLAVKKRN